MTTATAQRRTTFLEDVTTNRRAMKVDRGRGIIHAVKVLGWESSNDRVYDRAAVKRALPLYEGIAVNVDHPTRATDTISSQGRFGKLVNARIEADGLYADLHYLKSHPMAERIAEAAERMPGLFGLSHNVAVGKTESRGGKVRVLEILGVRSVDLVAEPATTNGLFESRAASLLEQVSAEALRMLGPAVAALIADTKLSNAEKIKRISAMLDGLNPELPAPEDPVPDEDETAQESRERDDLQLSLDAIRIRDGKQLASWLADSDEPASCYVPTKRNKKQVGTRLTEARSEIDVPEFADAKEFASWLAD